MKFDLRKVIYVNNKENAIVGKTYYYNDLLIDLKNDVEDDRTEHRGKLVDIKDYAYSFIVEDTISRKDITDAHQFLYPID